MEPLFFKAENAERRYTFPTQRHRTFNGAAFFQSGKSRGVFTRYRHSLGGLQWSRFFSKRKITTTDFSRAVLSTFNGAAFFQSGKLSAPRTTLRH